MTPVHELQNQHWQVGVLPQTGASLAFGRVRYSGTWLDVLRPTPQAAYGSSSKCSSFIMLPWCNRIREGRLVFNARSYPLATTPDDGTARHGDVRNRPWAVQAADSAQIRLHFDSRQHGSVNFPFVFTADAEYRLEGRDLLLTLALTNADAQPFPAGFGHHPYFVRPDGDSAPQVQLPCEAYFPLTDYMATGAPQPVPPALDYRQPRLLPPSEVNDVLTGRIDTAPARVLYPAWKLALDLYADALFAHWLLFAPPGQPFVAVEPMSNVSDGFNLFADGVPGSGVFVLQPGETRAGTVTIRQATL